MNGLQAISAANGWMISLMGISIVFTGLVMLCLIISQLHKALAFWDDRRVFREKIRQRWERKTIREDLVKIETEPSPDLEESARQMKVLVQWIGEPFSLPCLLKTAGKRGMFRPHSTINELIRAGHIVPDQKGYYNWKD